MSVWTRTATVLVLTLVGAGVRAQDAAPGPGRPAPGEARRDEAFRLVDAYVVSNLQESLGLSDDQFVRVLPLVKRLQVERRSYLLARTRVMRELRRLMRGGGSATDAQLVEPLRELKSLELEGPARVKREADALDAVLSPLQQARFRLLEIDVEQRMRELMNRSRLAPGARRQPQ